MPQNSQKNLVKPAAHHQPNLFKQASGMVRCYQYDHLWTAFILPFLPTKAPPSLWKHFHFLKPSLWTRVPQTEVQAVRKSQRQVWLTNIIATNRMNIPDFLLLGAWPPAATLWKPLLRIGGATSPMGCSQPMTEPGRFGEVGRLLGDREYFRWPIWARGHSDILAKHLFDCTSV